MGVQVHGRSGLSKYFAHQQVELPMLIGQLKSLPSGSEPFVRIANGRGGVADPGVGVDGDLALEHTVLTYTEGGALELELYGTPNSSFTIGGHETVLDAKGGARISLELDEMLSRWPLSVLDPRNREPIVLEATFTPKDGPPQRTDVKLRWSSAPLKTLTARFDQLSEGHGLPLREDRPRGRAALFLNSQNQIHSEGPEGAKLADVDVIGRVTSTREHKLGECGGYQSVDSKTLKPRREPRHSQSRTSQSKRTFEQSTHATAKSSPKNPSASPSSRFATKSRPSARLATLTVEPQRARPSALEP